MRPLVSVELEGKGKDAIFVAASISGMPAANRYRHGAPFTLPLET